MSGKERPALTPSVSSRLARATALVWGMVTLSTITGWCAVPTAQSFATVLLNGAGPDDTGALIFEPGKANTLTVAPDWAALGEVPVRLRVRVLKRLPSGDETAHEKRVEVGGAVSFDLGPMTAPALFDFEAGVVYRRGYVLDLALLEQEAGRLLWHVALHQGLSANHEQRGAKAQIPAGPERLLPGDARRVVYLHQYGIESALDLRLADDVLRSPDDARALCRLNPGACADSLACRLIVTGPEGTQVQATDVTLGPPGQVQTVPLDAAEWPEGDFRVSLYPVIAGKCCPEGPEITYRRRTADPREVRISPWSPWSLQRDPDRDEVTLRDFAAHLPGGQGEWTIEDAGAEKALVCPAGLAPEPLSINPGLSGCYAVFALPHADGCLLQVGDDPLIRPVRSSDARHGERTSSP